MECMATPIMLFISNFLGISDFRICGTTCATLLQKIMQHCISLYVMLPCSSAASWALRLEAQLILMIFIFSTAIHARYIYRRWALLEAGHTHLLVGLSLLRMPVRAYNNNICYQYPMCISSLGSNHHTSASTNTTSIITSTFIITTHRPLPHQLSQLRSNEQGRWCTILRHEFCSLWRSIVSNQWFQEINAQAISDSRKSMY